MHAANKPFNLDSALHTVSKLVNLDSALLAVSKLVNLESALHAVSEPVNLELLILLFSSFKAERSSALLTALEEGIEPFKASTRHIQCRSGKLEGHENRSIVCRAWHSSVRWVPRRRTLSSI